MLGPAAGIASAMTIEIPLQPCLFSDLFNNIHLTMMLRTALLRAPLASTRLARPTARTFHTTRPAFSGLTNLFEASDNPPLSVDKLTNDGFLLSDGLVVPGGVIFADGRAFMWDVDPPHLEAGGTLEGAWKGWTKERFEVFERLVPRPGEC